MGFKCLRSDFDLVDIFLFAVALCVVAVHVSDLMPMCPFESI